MMKNTQHEEPSNVSIRLYLKKKPFIRIEPWLSDLEEGLRKWTFGLDWMPSEGNSMTKYLNKSYLWGKKKSIRLKL